MPEQLDLLGTTYVDVGTPIGTGIGSVSVVFASSLGAIGLVGTSFMVTSLAGTRAFFV